MAIRGCPRPADMGSGMGSGMASGMASEWNRRLRPDVLTGDVMPMGCLGCTIPAALGVLGMIGAAAALIGTFL